jgi:hypothetical protein
MAGAKIFEGFDEEAIGLLRQALDRGQQDGAQSSSTARGPRARPTHRSYRGVRKRADLSEESLAQLRERGRALAETRRAA